jgi:hypothetical protein
MIFYLINGEYQLIINKTISPNSSTIIHTINKNEITNFFHLNIEIIRYIDNDKTPPKYLSIKKKWKSTQLLSNSSLLPFEKNEKGYLEGLIIEETTDSKLNSIANNKFNIPEILDLHIEKLFPNNTNQYLMNALEFQRLTINQTIESCVYTQTNKIIFIHGIGNGVLKRLLWDIAQNHPFVFSIQEADYHKFGFGASEVIFK